jgi:F-type H+-transporting ATPase subunit gamma
VNVADERQLQRQIESIDGLRDVIYSMRSLAATYLRRAEDRLDGVRAYAQTVGQGIADCLAGREIHPPQTGPGEIAVVAFFSEQGLCGRFNEVMAEAARDHDRPLDHPAFIAVGRRGPPLLHRHGLRVEASLRSVSNPEDTGAVIHHIAEAILAGYEAGRFLQCYLLYAGYLSPGSIEPRLERILPLDLTPWRSAGRQEHAPPRMGMPRLDLLRRLVNEYAFTSLARAFTESLAAENGMRLASMEGAKSNIDDTLDDLRQKARIERQNVITQELLDLVGGTEALRT